jgi:hypothetical protein
LYGSSKKYFHFTPMKAGRSNMKLDDLRGSEADADKAPQ